MSARVINPDAAILDAFEKVRTHRAYAYSFDNVPDDQVDEATEKAIEAADAEMLGFEAVVHTTPASTIGGVIARLLLAIPQIDQDRWPDITLMQDGLLALHRERYNLNPDAEQIISAAFDLLQIDWRQALEAYEQSSADFSAIQDVKAVAENEQMACRNRGKPNEFAEAVTTAIDGFSTRMMENDWAAVHRLLRTPAPDWQAYRRKAEIAIKESLEVEASTWLLRDANALISAQTAEAGA